MNFAESMEKLGYYVQQDLNFDGNFLERLRSDTLKWCDICARFQISAGISTTGDGTAHHSLGGNDSIQELIVSHPFDANISEFFEGKPYILHACNPVSGSPGVEGYVRKVHRDTQTYIENYRFRINILLALEDFTTKNGATQILPIAVNLKNPPGEREFEENHVEIKLKKGQALYFNSYLWHRGGKNVTTDMRPAITLSYGPPYIKPQMDYVRLMGDGFFLTASEKTRQVLGYYSRVPATLEEWYKSRDARFYRSDQG